MDFDKATELPNQGDFLMIMFQKGIHQVIEKIFLSLRLETIRRCKKVNSDWQGMLNFYLESNISRINKIVRRCMPSDPKVSIF